MSQLQNIPFFEILYLYNIGEKTANLGYLPPLCYDKFRIAAVVRTMCRC
jgi:hypothetical protein